MQSPPGPGAGEKLGMFAKIPSSLRRRLSRKSKGPPSLQLAATVEPVSPERAGQGDVVQAILPALGEPLPDASATSNPPALLDDAHEIANADETGRVPCIEIGSLAAPVPRGNATSPNAPAAGGSSLAFSLAAVRFER